MRQMEMWRLEFEGGGLYHARGWKGHLFLDLSRDVGADEEEDLEKTWPYRELIGYHELNRYDFCWGFPSLAAARRWVFKEEWWAKIEEAGFELLHLTGRGFTWPEQCAMLREGRQVLRTFPPTFALEREFI